MVVLLAILVIVSVPIGVLIVRRLELRSFPAISGVGFALYAVEALLLASMMVLPEGAEEGVADAMGDALMLGLSGMVLFSPIGVPLIVGVAYRLSR